MPSAVDRGSVGSADRVVGIGPGDVGSVFTTGWRVKWGGPFGPSMAMIS